MRKIIPLVILLLCTVMSCNESEDTIDQQRSTCLPINLEDGVIAFYPFINGSIEDESGNNYHLTNPTTASSTSDRAGNINCAFRFDNANDEFLEFINPSFLNGIENSSFSISLWYNSEIAGGEFISRRCNICTDQSLWSIGSYDNNWPFVGINGNNAIAITSTNNEQLNEWHHLVVTSNNAIIKIYQDGLLISDDSQSTGNTPINPNTSNLLVGKFYKGLLDDIIIYNRLLSQTEITELASLPVCCN